MAMRTLLRVSPFGWGNSFIESKSNDTFAIIVDGLPRCANHCVPRLLPRPGPCATRGDELWLACTKGRRRTV